MCGFSLLFYFKNILSLTLSVLLTYGYNKRSFQTLSLLLLLLGHLAQMFTSCSHMDGTLSASVKDPCCFSAWWCHLWIVHKLMHWSEYIFPVLLLCFRIYFYFNTSDSICFSSKNKLIICSNCTLNSEMHIFLEINFISWTIISNANLSFLWQVCTTLEYYSQCTSVSICASSLTPGTKLYFNCRERTTFTKSCLVQLCKRQQLQLRIIQPTVSSVFPLTVLWNYSH